MILVDTSVWIDFFNNKNNWQTLKLDELLNSEIILIGDLIFTEILQGFKKDTDFEQVKENLSILPFVNMLNRDLSIKSANNYRKLRNRGITVRKTIDCIIATYCIENKIKLLHNDKDFKAFEENLKLLTVKNKKFAG